jgi:small nuclear ribonucleoprotein (snRNP)-like protein
VTVELKNDLAITGTLHSVDQYLNIKLTNTRVENEQKYPHMVRQRIREAGGGGGGGICSLAVVCAKRRRSPRRRVAHASVQRLAYRVVGSSLCIPCRTR